MADLFTPYLVVRASGKIRSFAFENESATTKGGIQVRRYIPKQLMINLSKVYPPNIHSYSCHYQTMRLRFTTSLNP